MIKEPAAAADPKARPDLKAGPDPKGKPDVKGGPDPRAKPDSKARTDAKPGETPPQKKRGRGLLYALLALLVLAAAGAWLLAGDDPHPQAAASDAPDAARAEEPETPEKPEKPAKPAKAEPSKPPQFVALETLTVNLREDSGGEHYLQVGLTYQVSASEVAEVMKLHLPVIRSNILLLLSSKSPKQIVTVEGKTKLSEELLVAARQPLPGDEDTPKGITAVHYSSFIIQ
jgi:flagellar FliL protein